MRAVTRGLEGRGPGGDAPASRIFLALRLLWSGQPGPDEVWELWAPSGLRVSLMGYGKAIFAFRGTQENNLAGEVLGASLLKGIVGYGSVEVPSVLMFEDDNTAFLVVDQDYEDRVQCAF